MQVTPCFWTDMSKTNLLCQDFTIKKKSNTVGMFYLSDEALICNHSAIKNTLSTTLDLLYLMLLLNI